MHLLNYKLILDSLLNSQRLYLLVRNKPSIIQISELYLKYKHNYFSVLFDLSQASNILNPVSLTAQQEISCRDFNQEARLGKLVSSIATTRSADVTVAYRAKSAMLNLSPATNSLFCRKVFRRS